MTGETDTSLDESGTDNAQLSDSDTPDPWDYFDPDEDTEESQQEEGTDDEADEIKTDDEAEADEAEDDQEADEPDEAKPAVVKLADGTEITHDELIKGYHRQSDYTRKMQEVANDRQATSKEAERITSIADALVEHLTKLIPPEPDTALALSDAGQYTARKAQHDAAVAQLQKIIELGGEAKNVTSTLSDADLQKLKANEDHSLVTAIPSVGTQEGRKKFMSEVADAARHVGFSDEDVGKVVDHRVFLLAHWAQKGLAADKAKKAAKAKAQKAPPANPRKPGQGAKQAGSNVKAMQKLARTGSIHDAVNVDFD